MLVASTTSTDIDSLTFTEAELIRAPEVREVVNLLSTLTGQTPVNVD
jgi:hypothetical protein